jgi:hypothetical protein
MQTYAFASLLLAALSLFSLTLAQSKATSKRGLAYHGDDHAADNHLLLSENSSIAWYYTWSLYQANAIGGLATFLPLVHGLDEAENANMPTLLNRLPSSSTHLLTFNEPDGDTGSGGSNISPEDAAKSYISKIVPLRKGSGAGSRTWNISQPVVTGSGRGLEWLRSFNQSCYNLDREGCPHDFVAVHWYGDFPGLASWLNTLREFYNGNTTGKSLKFRITEMALPQQDTKATLAMMTKSLEYLDGLGYVDGYAWFGAFRKDEANAWTGNQVSLFDDNGGLTELGAFYLGGEAKGFTEGLTGDSSDTAAVRHSAFIYSILMTFLVMIGRFW